jgi:hypothetical protein
LTIESCGCPLFGQFALFELSSNRGISFSLLCAAEDKSLSVSDFKILNDFLQDERFD